MGNKGDKLSGTATTATEVLLEKLSTIGSITSKKMFGGYGIFHNNKMFGMVNSKGEAFLKTDDTIKQYFEELNAPKHNRMPYYSIPSELLDAPEELRTWARRSIAILK